ncbi:MAG: hypothetical protein ACXVRN_12525 [Solirubrobacteraceae bacterium]
MRRPLRLVAFVPLLAVAALAPATAQGRPLRAPKWLKPPYRQYVLTYDASDSAQGSEVTSMPNAPGQGPCDSPMTTYQDSQSAHYHAAYQFLFGRSLQGRSLKPAFVYVLRKVSGPAQHAYNSLVTPPPGCPAPDPRDTRFGSSSCTRSTRADGKPDFTVGGPRRRHGALVFGLALDPQTTSGEPACTGNDFLAGAPDAAHVPEVTPATGSLVFSDRSVVARRTLTGTVQFDPGGVHSGGGTDPETDTRPQDVWTFNVSEHGTFRLAPGTTAR